MVYKENMRDDIKHLQSHHTGSAMSIKFSFRRTQHAEVPAFSGTSRLQVLTRNIISRFHANVTPNLLGGHHIKPYHDRVYLQHKNISNTYFIYVNRVRLYTCRSPSKCRPALTYKKTFVRFSRSTNQELRRSYVRSLIQVASSLRIARTTARFEAAMTCFSHLSVSPERGRSSIPLDL